MSHTDIERFNIEEGESTALVENNLNWLNVSLIDFIKRFKEKTMAIYNGLLTGQRIIFVSYDGSCNELSHFVSCCINLVSPLNVAYKLFPFEHLLNLNFLEVKEYIAGVTNPLFATRKEWWDICCDVVEGTVIDNSRAGKPFKATDYIGQARLNQLDMEFFMDILRRIKENDITELQVRRLFYEYTKNFLDYTINASNLLDYPKEEKLLMESFENKGLQWKKSRFFEQYQDTIVATKELLKCVFSESYLDVSQALNDFVEKKAFNDYELLKHYSVLVDNLNTPKNLELFLKLFVARKADVSVLTVGLMTPSEEVQKKATEFLMRLESPEGTKILERMNALHIFMIDNNKRLYNVKID
jgi:hypothetical protein